MVRETEEFAAWDEAHNDVPNQGKISLVLLDNPYKNTTIDVTLTAQMTPQKCTCIPTVAELAANVDALDVAVAVAMKLAHDC